MGQPLFRRSLFSFASATACLTLIGCGGSSATNPATVDPYPSAAAGSSTTVAGASANPPANSTGAGGSAGVGPIGGGGISNTPAAGAPQAGSPTTNGSDFSHGSRLVIPQRTLTSVTLGPDGAFNNPDGPTFSLANIDATTNTQFADAAIYPRQFEVGFNMSGLFVKDCQIWPGKFEVSTLDVKQDVNGSGAHLQIELVNGHYQLTHDGPGAHRIRVTGNFKADRNSDTVGLCPSLPMGPISVPVAFTTNITIVRMGSVKASAPCTPGSFMLSGRNYPGTRISLLDESGQPILRPANVYDTYPLDVIVETEKPAQIAEGGTSLGFSYDGLIVTGEPQTVRLSTAYGTLYTYQLANTAMIDDWDVKFWARDSQYVKSATYPLTMDGTPIVAPGRVIGATASLEIGGVPLCGPVLATDFKTDLSTPSVCNVEHYNSPDPYVGDPGFLATFVDDGGTCEFDLSVPGANGERGLKAHFSATLSPTAQAPF